MAVSVGQSSPHSLHVAPATMPRARPVNAPTMAPVLTAVPRVQSVSIVVARSRKGSASAESTTVSELRSSSRPSCRPTSGPASRTHWLSARLSKAVCRSVLCCAVEWRAHGSTLLGMSRMNIKPPLPRRDSKPSAIANESPLKPKSERERAPLGLVLVGKEEHATDNEEGSCSGA
jgi:hypothetical protein